MRKKVVGMRGLIGGREKVGGMWTERDGCIFQKMAGWKCLAERAVAVAEDMGCIVIKQNNV